tara:strand:+ start:1169 stop:1369 length:201 start_codon:yes stop_codon:yes gene_type:complete
MKPSCYFQIPRGNTNRYIYVFYLYGNEYTVLKKQLLGNQPYKTVVKYKIPSVQIKTFINTVVANTY